MCGEFSSVRLRPEDVRYSEPSPTHLNLMAARWASLRQTLAGDEKTGVALIGEEGSHLVPTGAADDAGLDYFVPRLARFLRMPLPESVDFFLVYCFCYAVHGPGTWRFLRFSCWPFSACE